jgi:tRNA dimethylallyltransferase
MSANPGQPLLAAGEWAGTYIQPDPAWLKARIDQRFMTMIAEGAIDEVRLLLARQPALSPNLGVMKAHGVPHLSAHIRGALSLDGAIERGQQDTRAYARRQGVFARRYFTGPGWTWIDSADAE